MTFSIVIMVGRGYFLPTHVHEASNIFQTLGILECQEMLPPAVYASELCGEVTEEAARMTGLAAGTPVAAGAHDMIACSVGAGGRRQGHLAIIMGTMGINIAVVDKETSLKKVKPGESFEFAGAFLGKRTATTSIGSACNTMNWFLDMFFQKEKEEARVKGINVFQLLEERLVYDKPVSLIFQPYLLGTFYNSRAKAGITGITAATRREDILMALFQGIAVSMGIEIERLENRVGIFDDIWLVGGGANSTIWGQMFADILNRLVKTCRTDEVGCRGAAICAGVAIGRYDVENGIPGPEIGKLYTPRKTWHQEYQKQMQVYKASYEANSDIWEAQSQI